MSNIESNLPYYSPNPKKVWKNKVNELIKKLNEDKQIQETLKNFGENSKLKNALSKFNEGQDKLKNAVESITKIDYLKSASGMSSRYKWETINTFNSFDDKTQLDLNCLWISSLVAANEILPDKGYLKIAEEYFSKIEKKYIENNIYHSYSKEIVFIEDYAFLINALNDLSDKTMSFKYKNLAKKLSIEAIDKFFLKDKNIFQKNPKISNDVFFKPIDISDNTIPNGNAIMLINFIRLGMMDEARKLSESLNGYLNVYKNHMMTSLRAIDYFNNVKDGKNCNEQGCKVNA